MLKRVTGLAIFSLVMFSLPSFAQVTSISDGQWDDPTIWNTGNVPTSAGGAISIDHAIFIPDGISAVIDQAVIESNGYLTVDAGGTLTIAAGAGDDLTINGILDVNGTLINNHLATIANTDGNNLNFYDGGLFQWLYTAGIEGVPPLASWSPASTIEIKGYTSAEVLTEANWVQTYGNFVWNCASQTGNVSLSGLITEIQGNFTVQSTGAGTTAALRFTDGQTGVVMNINGSLNVSGNSRLHFTNSGEVEVMIGGDFNFTSTNGTGSNMALAGTGTASIAGDFVMNATGGRLRAGTGSTSTTGGILNIGKDFRLLAGSIDETGTNTSMTFNFNSGIEHLFINSGAFSGQMRYYIGPDDILNLGNNNLLGAANSMLTVDGTIKVGSNATAGAIQNSTTLGNIRLGIPYTNRVYNPGSKVIYNGATAQFLGSGHPVGTGVNTIIDNPAGASVAFTSVTISGDLTLQQGNLNVASTGTTRGLTILGNIISNGNYINYTGTTSDLVIGGSGDLGAFPFAPAATPAIRNFTLNRNAGSVTFTRPVVISGITSLTAGDLIFNGQLLTLNGSFNSGGGALSSNASSSLTIGGTGAFGTLIFSGSGNTLNTLTFNRTSTGTASLDGSLTVITAFNLNNGAFTNNSALTLANNAVLTRSGGSLLGTRVSTATGEFYDVVYSGSTMTTSLEIPDPVEIDNLGSLTINGGPVTLAHSIVVNENMNLTANTLNAGLHTITMKGAQWNDNGGTFNAGTGTVIFDGSTTIGGASPTFGNIQLNASRTLNMPAGTVGISGNIQLDFTGSFNANNGTILLNGSALQAIGGGGRTMANITVNKSGGSDVILNSPILLTGILNVQSASDFNSNNNLVLLSTSDKNTGNASIAALLNGATVSGNVTVQRYMEKEIRMYRYISSPITDASVAELQASNLYVTGPFSGSSTCTGCTTNASMFIYDGATSTYSRFPVSSNTETLTPGRGYSVFVRHDILPGPLTLNLNGPINSGTVILPVGHNPVGESWNLVGNPYPSTIDWDNVTGWSRTNIGNNVAVRDNTTGSFMTWNGATGSLTGGQVASGQAFWVMTTGAPSLSINENAKTGSTAEFFREEQEEQMDPNVLVVAMTRGIFWDKAHLQISDGASAKYDNLDFPKLKNDFYNLSMLTSDGKSVAINVTDDITCGSELRLKLEFTKNEDGTYFMDPKGVYDLAFEQIGNVKGYDVLLVDKFKGTSRKLSAGDKYSFEINDNVASLDQDRFSVQFSEASPATNLEVSGDLALCENTPGKITLTGASAGIHYQLLKGGSLVQELAGNANLEFTIPATFINADQNDFIIQAVGACGSIFPVRNLTISRTSLSIPQIVKGRVCTSGTVTLKASAPNAVTYNWYDSEFATEPVLGIHTSEFTTAELTKSKTFFVSAVNAAGCESMRVPVMAEVVSSPELTIETEGEILVASEQEGNQWYFEGEAISGAVSATYKPVKSGLYSVINSLSGCTSMAQLQYFAGETAYPKGLRVFPNPVQQDLSFSYSDQKLLEGASLWDINGKKVADFSIQNDGMNRKGQLNVRNLPAGTYIVKFFVEKELVVVKIIKD